MIRKNGSLHRGMQITACQMLDATVAICMLVPTPEKIVNVHLGRSTLQMTNFR